MITIRSNEQIGVITQTLWVVKSLLDQVSEEGLSEKAFEVELQNHFQRMKKGQTQTPLAEGHSKQRQTVGEDPEIEKSLVSRH